METIFAAYFNIHDLLTFKVLTRDEGFLKYLMKEYAFFFEPSPIDKVDVELVVNNFGLENNNCQILNNKYYVKKDYFYCEDSYKIVRWRVQIQGLEQNKTLIQYYSNAFPDFLCRYIIEPLLRFKLNQKGYTFLHSSGISNGENAFLFCATKGVGKTSTVLNFVKDGNTYLSDDFTILSKDGKVYSYPTTIHLFAYNLEACPFVTEKLKTKEKVLVKLYDYIYKISMKYAQLSTDIHATELFDTNTQETLGIGYPLKKLFLLTRTNGNKVIMQNIEKEELIDKLIAIDKFEAFNFLDYMRAYSYAFPNSKIAKNWETFRKNLRQALKKVKCCEVFVPKHYTTKVFEKIKNEVNKSEH